MKQGIALRLRGVLIVCLAAFACSACQNTSPRPIGAAPGRTPFPFITATPIPTLPAGTDTPQPAPAVTTIPTPTQPPPGLSTSRTPSITPSAAPTDAISLICPTQPDGPFHTIYATSPGLAPSLGCPVTQEGDAVALPVAVSARYQPMERGHLLWLSSIGWFEGRVVLALLDDATYARYDDTYIAGVDAASGGPAPPEGLFQPAGSLGKIWRETPGLTDRMGFGTAPEVTVEALMQLYQYGEMLYLPAQSLMFVTMRGEPGSWSVYTLGDSPG
jgi:hypothetical protein